MEITRHGTKRYRGTKPVISDLKLIAEKEDWYDNTIWDKHRKNIIVRARYIPHKDGRTHHDYQIKFTLEDVSSLITLLGNAATATDAVLLRDSLRNQVPALVKLLACATGVTPIPMAETTAKETKKTG